jgi:hypothetical protein
MKKKVKKFRVARTRNGNTMTESMFFQWLRQKLRRASMYWKPISQARKEAQVLYKGPNKRRKYSYVCTECHHEFPIQEVKVHHKIDCGSLNSFADLSSFAERLFCEKEGLIVLCSKCHNKIHGK